MCGGKRCRISSKVKRRSSDRSKRRRKRGGGSSLPPPSSNFNSLPLNHDDKKKRGGGDPLPSLLPFPSPPKKSPQPNPSILLPLFLFFQIRGFESKTGPQSGTLWGSVTLLTILSYTAGTTKPEWATTVSVPSNNKTVGLGSGLSGGRPGYWNSYTPH